MNKTLTELADELFPGKLEELKKFCEIYDRRKSEMRHAFCAVCGEKLSERDLMGVTAYDYNYTCSIHHVYKQAFNLELARQRAGVKRLKNDYWQAVWTEKQPMKPASYFRHCLVNHERRKIYFYDRSDRHNEFARENERCAVINTGRFMDWGKLPSDYEVIYDAPEFYIP